jgi:hypothetical protein
LLADIAGFYRAFALGPAEGQPEIEDHIGAELEFMSALTLKEAWAIAENQPEALEITQVAERTFLRDHLARWVPGFAARVTAAATLGFHPAAAVLLEAWLAAECARLGVTAAPLEGTNTAEVAAFACPMASATEDSPIPTRAEPAAAPALIVDQPMSARATRR